MPTTQDVKNPIYADASGNAINCEVLFEGYDNYLPFTATSYDTEAYGVELYNQLVAGDWGLVAPYVAPPAQEYALISPNDKVYDNSYTPPVVLGYRVVAVSIVQTTPPSPLYWVGCPDYVTPSGYYYDGQGSFAPLPAGVK
jgi:hypothetical protein